jgi:hypothetical protein
MSIFRSAELQGLNPVNKVLTDAKEMLARPEKEKIGFILAA